MKYFRARYVKKLTYPILYASERMYNKSVRFVVSRLLLRVRQRNDVVVAMTATGIRPHTGNDGFRMRFGRHSISHIYTHTHARVYI